MSAAESTTGCIVMATIVLGAGGLISAGYSMGARHTAKDYQKQAVDRGYAEYGRDGWHWLKKDEVKP